MLIKIGDFARETGVTIKALRHYEELGLLKPAWINRYNGYRYYAPEQQAKLGLLLAYKEMGFSLKQIKGLLDAQLTTQELQTMLAEHMRALDSQINKDLIKLDSVRTCIERLQLSGRPELENSLSTRVKPITTDRLEEKMEIQIKHLPAMKLVGLCYRGKNENNEIAMTWSAFNRLSHKIKHFTGEAAYGVCSIPEGLPDGAFEYLCAFPVAKFEDIPQDMTEVELEPMQAAVFEHRGSYETLGDTYTAIYQKWLPEAGLKPLKNGLDLEVYTDAFKDFAPDSSMYIYVPIQV